MRMKHAAACGAAMVAYLFSANGWAADDADALHITITQGHQDSRNNVSPDTGTNAYKLDAQSIQNLPQGDDTELSKVLVQMPGVAEDSKASGGTHIRGEHANLQYRINGVMLPDGISGFGDTIDTHIVENATLLDGALPAQYGFRTAGIVDINTKNGFMNGGTASMMGGSNNTLQPSVSYGGIVNDIEYFGAATHLSSDLGIENPTSGHTAIHDHTEQDKQFLYAASNLDEAQRVQVIAGNSISYFQIPNNPNQMPSYQLNGIATMNSADLNERQFESNQFATMAWQGSTDRHVNVQIAPFVRKSELHYRPDVTGDLLFNGVASDINRQDLSTGIQNDNSWQINAAHTLSAGLHLQNDHVNSDNTSYAFMTDASGNALTDGSGNNIQSSAITNNHTKDGQLYGLYLQDEWHLTDKLTMNYGARFDDMEQYISANQLSPRLGFVYKATNSTILHAGYARYFTPPPQELISNGDINSFANTTNAPTTTQNSPVKPERSHAFDAGITQQIGQHWQFGLDGYYKLVTDLLDEGQFGAALIPTPFNYAQGRIYGSELTASYSGERLDGYFNFAVSSAMGKNIVSSQFNFTDAAELACISNHYVHLDHDQTYTASGGLSYKVLDATKLGVDGHFGSGLRRGFANEQTLPVYATFDLSAEQKLNLLPKDETTVRLSLINLFDTAYELRDGSGIGVGAPQWGARRGVFAALVQKF